MWLLFGIAAIITATLNIVRTVNHRDAKWFRFISLSLTAFTLCAFTSQYAHWAAIGDWSALQDVLPGMSRWMWILVGASVVINGISLFQKRDK